MIYNEKYHYISKIPTDIIIDYTIVVYNPCKKSQKGNI